MKNSRSTAFSRTAFFMSVCNRISLITVANVTEICLSNKQYSVKVYLITLFGNYLNNQIMKDTILERLKSVIAEKSNSASDFSKMIGIAQTTLSNQMKGPKGISIEVIMLTLDQFPDISAEWLLRGKGKMLLTDNMPAFNGDETETEEDLKIELSKVEAELEEYKLHILRLEAQKDYLQERNDDLVVSNRMLQDELNKYQ